MTTIKYKRCGTKVISILYEDGAKYVCVYDVDQKANKLTAPLFLPSEEQSRPGWVSYLPIETALGVLRYSNSREAGEIIKGIENILLEDRTKKYREFLYDSTDLVDSIIASDYRNPGLVVRVAKGLVARIEDIQDALTILETVTDTLRDLTRQQEED